MILLDPADWDAYYIRGKALLENKEPEKALADFSEVLRLSPEHVPALSNRAFLYLTNKEYDKAIADYSRVIRLDSYDVGAYSNRGMAPLGKGRL